MKIKIKRKDAEKLARLLAHHVGWGSFPFAQRIFESLMQNEKVEAEAVRANPLKDDGNGEIEMIGDTYG